ncbi:VCBS repeat-containing protein [uncultured Polaribacter sp.]|jgi:hypothetical protein|uniref:VCBS repeat-containing protein n=1 Tax=uncultured Polaribacter sp. TaxID=174711 RepID=UPI0037043123
MKINFFILKSLFALCLLMVSCQNSKRDLYPENLIGGFELLSVEKTGIDFNNAITETETLNHIYYNQIYSGAGVAIGDINNDGLPDVFFCGNKVNDKLYLNKGDFKFEDISKNSKITRSPGWSWGVTMADVNSDGYLDIYVSRNGESMTPSDRENKLFINNKDLTFTESANKYGLADAGFSSQAVFFDMDNDGDLDMYQVNQIPDARLFKRYKNIPKKRYKLYTDKIYKNENGKYKDVSKEANLINRYTYGLSVSASDLNNDGWVDLYVSNDYDQPDFLYYNNGDGTFKNVVNEKLKHISRFSMGTDTGDINNDGYMDIFTLDMASEDHYRSKTNMKSMNAQEFKQMTDIGDHYQYMFNTLQINNGLGEFSDIAQIAGLAKTDWSWAGLMVDVDNDGFKDIVISNGVKKDVRNNDFLTGLYEKLKTNSQDFFEMSKLAPSNPLPNYIYKNKNGFEFENVTSKWNFALPSFSNGISYGDLDNDGDLDLVINNIDSPASIYKNNASGNFFKVEFEGAEKNKFGYDTKVVIHHNNKIQTAENTVTRGYFSSIEPKLFFGLGLDKEVDKVEVFWKDGKYKVYNNITANTILKVRHSDAVMDENQKDKVKRKPLLKQISSESIGISYKHLENEFDEFKEEILLPHNISQNGPYSSVADVNNDGLEDLFIGGSKDTSGILYLQNKEGKFKRSISQPWEKDKASEDLGVLFFDIDNDNDKDLFITSGGSEYKQGNPKLQDRIYLNDGKGFFTKTINRLPKIYESSQCVKESDIDNDGDLDLFIGTRLISGKYTHPASSYFLINNNGFFKKSSQKNIKEFEDLGMVTDASFSDIDNDGDEDLLVVGEWMQIQVFENKKGFFKNATNKYGLNNLSRGFWWSITKGDIDNDGDDDFIVGNLGRNNKFKATKEHPFKVYANDFDNNGTNDVVLAKYYKDAYVPLRGKECTTQQMPYVSEKFKDYHSFASSKLLDILPKDKIEGAVIYQIENFESIVLINENGRFKNTSLPIEAQVSPIKDAMINDFNNDGYQDVILIGNHYGVEVETTRYDAGNGLILLGDGKNNFTSLSSIKSGVNLFKDSRSISSLKLMDKNILVITSNKDSLNIVKY